MKKLPIPSFVSNLVPTFVSDFAKDHVPECVIDAAADAIPVAATAAMILYPHSSHALSISAANEVSRSGSSGTEISGISWAGGNKYYVVNDTSTEVKLYEAEITLGSNGSISSFAFKNGVELSGVTDLEGCAWDPASGNVWVSSEGSTASIREFDPTTGNSLRVAELPPVVKNNMRGNFKLEALTISGDGLTMWAANEEALSCDGAVSTTPRATGGTTVRLIKFTRPSVYGEWTAVAQYAYKTYGLNTPLAYHNVQRSGVAGLCALPDGQLLVLERECSGMTANQDPNSLWDGLATHFTIAVCLADYSNASDVSTLPSLDGATYVPVSKTNITGDLNTSTKNYEGICLGPRISDEKTALLFVSDGGSSAGKYVMSKILSGLDIRTVTVVDGEGGAAEPVGGPYRYVGGQTVTVEQPGATGPYSSRTRDHWLWYTTSGAEGTGGTASFVPGIDDTLTWNPNGYDGSLALLGVDSFERLALDTEASALANWTGDGFVAAERYDVPAAPGYPLADEDHTQVLVVDGESARDYSAAHGSGNRFDAMLRVTRERADTPVADAEDAQVALFFDETGRATLQHRSIDGSTRLRTPLSSRIFEDGDWVRASIVLDYSSDPSGAAWCQVRLDGEPCRTAAGVKSPADKVAGGSWHRLLATPAAAKVSSVLFKGTGAVDDLALYESSSEVFERSGLSTTNGVPYEWLLEHDLPFDTALDLDGDNQDTRLEYAAGTDPWDAEDNFRVTGAGFNAAGRFEIRYTGSDAQTNTRLGVVTAESLEDILDEDDWTAATGTTTRNGSTNVWTQLPTLDTASESRFYKVRVTLPED